MTKLINITVDDSAPDPYSGQTILYTPVGHWIRGQDCVGCLAQPDANMTYGRTWHDTTYDPGVANRNQIESAVFSFVDFNSTTDLSLFIDNQPYSNFSYAPPGPSDFGYNTTLFAVRSIPHGPHTLILQNGFPNGRVSLLLLDYLVYTTEINETVSASSSSTGSPTASSTSELLQPTSLRPSSSPGLHCSSSNKAETIVLALLGGVLLVLLAVLYILELRRRHSQHDDELNGTAEAGSPLGSPRSCILEPSISANSSYTIRASPSTASSYTLQTLPSYGSSLTLRNPPSSVRDSRGPSSHNAADVSNICVAELSLHSDIESTNPQEDARVARQLEKLRILSDRNARRRSHLF